MNRTTLVLAAVLLGAAACGSNSSPGTQSESIEPCNGDESAFDVWRADFDPGERTQLNAFVDTTNGATAAELRLVVACGGEVVIDTFTGLECSHDPPSNGAGGSPECPGGNVPIEQIATGARIECLAEVTSTEPLGIGFGACADPGRADYEIRLNIDGSDLALELVSDDCRAASSCL